MRFCPFCSAENLDEANACGACSRRLPPLPPRRQRQSEATGILATRPMRATDASVIMKPAVPDPVQPPLPPPAEVNATPTPVVYPSAKPSGDASPVAYPPANADALRAALTPGPAAMRREAPAPEPREAHEPARRRHEASIPPPVPSDARSASGPTPVPVPSVPVAPSVPVSPSVPVPVPVPPSASVPVPPSASVPVPVSVSPSASVAVPPSASVPVPVPVSVSASVPVPVPVPVTVPVSASVPVPVPASPSASVPVPVPASADSSTQTPLPPVMYPSAVAEATAAASTRATSKADTEPPPTRVFRADAMADRPFAPPKVLPVPEIPEPGLLPAAKYAVGFARARWQRRKAIKVLGAEVKQDTIALDQVLGALGAAARIANVEGRVFNTENAAITAAEQRRSELQGEQQGLDGRTAEESAKFADIETERTTKLNEAEKVLDGAKRDNETFEAQRRGLRDKRKEIERRQKAYLKAAEDRDNESANTSMGEVRSQMRRAAEGHRREAAELEPERQDLDRKLSAIEKPLLESQARLDAAKAEYDSAKRSLNDAREGHGHRLAELDAEKKRKLRDISAADNEISRRLVTLGTLVNLNRVEDPSFVELYERIDRLKGAITARTTEAEKLTAERSAYHRESLIRGAVVIGGAIVAFIALIVILRAIF